MKIITAIMLTAFLLMSVQCKSEESSKLDLSSIFAPVLKLKVIPSFSPPAIYSLSRGEVSKLQIIRYKGAGGYDWGKISRNQTVTLTKSETNKVMSLLDSALDLPLRDDVRGKDGSKWILESYLYQKLEVSMWSPRYDTVKRGYVNIVKLEEYLEALSKKYESKKVS